MDTAGIRDTSDIVEKIGVDRARDFARDADLLIHVIDASSPLDDNDLEIFQMLHGKQSVILLNKTDLKMKVLKKMLKRHILQVILQNVRVIMLRKKMYPIK